MPSDPLGSFAHALSALSRPSRSMLRSSGSDCGPKSELWRSVSHRLALLTSTQNMLPPGPWRRYEPIVQTATNRGLGGQQARLGEPV